MSSDKEIEKPSLFGMITSPTEQFRRIKERPMIWGAMGIIVVLFIIGSWLNMREVDLFSGMEVDEELVGLSDTFKVYGAIIGGVLGPLLGVLTVSAVFFLISKIVEVNVSFRQLFSMNTYISLITVFGLIINGGLSMLYGDLEGVFYTSLGGILNASGGLGVLFANLEVFSIWKLILTAIGLQKVAGYSKGLAWTIPIVFFVGGIIFGLMGEGLTGIVGG